MATFATNMGSAMAPRAKREPRPKRPSRAPGYGLSPAAAMQGAQALTTPPASTPKAAVTKIPAKIALTKPLAPLPSTKPSDTPMAQSRMKMGRGTAGIAPLPKMPKITPKPPAARSKQKLTSRPKTGTK